MSGHDKIVLGLYAPSASSRPWAKNDVETSHEVVAPSTVYGMLLSLLGEFDKKRYIGSKVACSYLRKPLVSREVRSSIRLHKPSQEGTSNPKVFEFFTDVSMVLSVEGELAIALNEAFDGSVEIVRDGGLYLGDSNSLISYIERFDTPEEAAEFERSYLLAGNDSYNDIAENIAPLTTCSHDHELAHCTRFPLSVWTGRKGSIENYDRQFSLRDGFFSDEDHVTIEPEVRESFNSESAWSTQ